MAKTITLNAFSISGTAYIYRYTASSGTFSSNLKGTTGHDLFDNSFAVDDALYFGQANFTLSAYLAFQFDVATAIAATSYTLAWEYYSNDGTWKPVNNLHDDTSSFSITGTNEVWFHTPEDCYHTTINGTLSKWYRCRITAVSSPTEGGAIGTTAIQYRYADLAVTGGTSADPITIDDLAANTDVIHYELIQEIGSGAEAIRSFNIHTHIQQNDTTGYMKFENMDLWFEFGYIGGTGTFIYGKPNGGGHPDIGINGCNISFNHNGSLYWGSGSGGSLYGYSTSFLPRRGQLITYQSDIYFYGCLVNAVSPIFGGKSINFTECNIFGLNSYTGSSTYDPYVNKSVISQVQAYQNSVGTMLRDTKINQFYVMYNTKAVTYDCEFASSSVGSTGSGAYADSYWYRHHSIAFTFIDKNGDPLSGVSVVIKDKDGNTPQAWVGTIGTGSLTNVSTLTSDSNGQCSTDLLEYIWHRIFNPTAYNIETDLSPFIVTISKSGYITQEFPLTMDKKYDLTLRLYEEIQPSPSIVMLQVDNNLAVNI